MSRFNRLARSAVLPLALLLLLPGGAFAAEAGPPVVDSWTRALGYAGCAVAIIGAASTVIGMIGAGIVCAKVLIAEL